MRVQGLWVRVVTAALVAVPVATAATAAPASAAGESETSFSYASTPGDFIGQGGSGTVTAPAQFSLTGTAGSLRFRADTGTATWTVELAAAHGRQLTTGVYESAARAGFNGSAPGLAVSTGGRGCNTVKGRFTIYALSADTAGRVTMLDATLTQFCDDTGGGMTATVRYAAPAFAPPVVTSSDPSTVAGQPVTFSARVAPTSAGGVVFYDGDTPIGQGSFDGAGTARLETRILGSGAHSITARAGGMASTPVTQLVADGDTSLWFRSEAGDYIGQGATASYVPSRSSFTVRGTAAEVSVSVDSPSTGQSWTVTLAAPPGDSLRVGTYTGAARAPFHGAGQPGLSVTGTGRGCNTLRGSFTVHHVVANADGSVASLDASFEQLCDAATAGLRGRVRSDAPPVDARTATTTTLGGAATSDGGVALTATVAGASGVPSGQVTFREGAATLGTATLDAAGRAVLLVPGATRGSHTFTAGYGGSQAHLPSAGTATVDVPGLVTATSMTVARTAKLGRATPVTVTVGPGGRPTGTVRLHDGAAPVGTPVTLVGGTATISWTPTAKGSRSLTVRYAGDGAHAPSVSAATVVKVT